MLGHYDEADTHFAIAAELSARGQMEFAAAATNLQWGVCSRPAEAQEMSNVPAIALPRLTTQP